MRRAAIVLLMGIFVFPCLYLSAALGAPSQASWSRVSVVVDSDLGPPAEHGLQRLIGALNSKNIRVERRTSLNGAQQERVIVVGLSNDSEAAGQLGSEDAFRLPSEPEALLVRKVRWNDKEILLICGADDRGLMYAAIDVARQIELSSDGADPFSMIREADEKPAVQERGLSKIVMSQSEFESYFYSEEYWARYLDLLAGSRYNTFLLMFGWNAPEYMSPPYPYLFDTDGFPGVQVNGMTPDKQRRNLHALRQIVRMTHERGMEFTLAIWMHIYRGEPTVPGAVRGLTDDNLVSYTEAAFKKFLDLVPGIDRIQFRVHVESALQLPQQIPFWKRIFNVIERSGQSIKVDMRAKGCNDDMIDWAVSTNLDVRLTTKYWGENMGLPFHPLHVEWRNQYDRRHGYADLLRYPKRHDMLWRLWNVGTTRVLLWGSREYVRRFVESTGLYESPGYEVSEPLAYKGADRRVPAYELLAKEYQYYEWEFERYWYFFQVFGRVGYDPDISPNVWLPEFESRFGKQAAPAVQEAYEIASQILPRIVGYNLVDLNSELTWAEKERYGDLPDYAKAPPSDTDLFVGIAEAANLYLENELSAKVWPEQTADWFEKTGQAVLSRVARAEESPPPHSKEFVSTMIDMKVLGNIALYHARRIPAGVSYALFERTQDLNALDDAIRNEKRAISIWEDIVKLTDGVYHDNMIMGSWLQGHWKDELKELRRGLRELEQVKKDFHPSFRRPIWKFDFGDGPTKEGYIRISSRSREARWSPMRGGYGWAGASLLPTPPGAGFVHGPPPTGYISSAFAVEVPDGHYDVQVVMQDNSRNPMDRGPMWVEVEGRHSTGKFTVPAGRRVEKTIEAEAVNGKLGIVFHTDTASNWMVSELVVTQAGPGIAHVPVRRARPGDALEIRATAGGASPIRRMRLAYEARQGGLGLLEMNLTDRSVYSATVPGSDVVPGLTYYLEVEDEQGRQVREAPIHVTVSDDAQAPRVTHARIQEATAGQPMTLEATVVDPSGVKSVIVRCRSVTQYQEYVRIPMRPTGANDLYVAEIPGKYLDSRWDFMYFIEASDTKGNGAIYPDFEREAPYVIVKLRR